MRSVDTVEYLYETYRSDVYRYLLGMTRDPDLAEDLLSDTFYTALGRWRGSGRMGP